MELISVIVPVYNTERYLEECVQSILDQTYSEIEVILVDDGSTDGSGAICDCLAKRDRRVKVVHQENCGLSGSRNCGLELCSGEYITFVDADDALDRRFLEILYGLLTEKNCDIALSSYQLYYGGEKTEAPDGIIHQYSRLECLGMLNGWRDTTVTCFIVAWGKLYRRSLWREIRFPLGVWHEDEFVAHQILNQIERVARIDMPMYFYRQHSMSFSANGMRNPAHDALFEALVQRCSFYQKYAPGLVNGSVHHLLRECNSFYDIYAQSDDKEFRAKRNWFVQTYRRVYFRYFGCISMQERSKGALFAFFPEVYHKLSLRKWNQQA